MSEKCQFSIKHVFTVFMKLEVDEKSIGNTELHFNIPWRITGVWPTDEIGFEIYLERLKPNDGGDWSIETEIGLEESEDVEKLTFSNQEPEHLLISMRLDEVYDKVSGPDLPIEFYVTIVKINGIFNAKCENERKRRCFDESAKKFSDVVLMIGDEKFYVCKMFLASHSSYFEHLFFGNPDESKQSEVEIKDINAADFQNFLELINGESFVDDQTVDGLLHLSEFFDSKTVFERCKEFLLEKSEKSPGEKIQMAIKYNMEILVDKSIDELKTTTDIQNAVEEVEKTEKECIWKKLLMKSLSLNE